LPYIWDEAGYYIPAARDLFFDGSLIPHSTVSNAHPPLVMAWVALWWKIFGATVLATRIAMLMVSSFALTGIFLLAEQIANRAVAIASTLCVACYSVFFTQSSLLHVDMAAAAFTFWGLRSYLSGRRVSAVIWFAAAGLAKRRRCSRLLPWRCGNCFALCLPGVRVFVLLLPTCEDPCCCWHRSCR